MKFSLSQRGQGMTEYIIIVALIAIAAIGVYRFFGDTVRNQTAAMAQELAGQSGTADNQRAGARADNASADAIEEKSLSNFTDNNGATAN